MVRCRASRRSQIARNLRSYIQVLPGLLRYGRTRKIARRSWPTFNFFSNAALNARLPPGATSLHPFPVFRSLPRLTLTVARFVFLVIFVSSLLRFFFFTYVSRGCWREKLGTLLKIAPFTKQFNIFSQSRAAPGSWNDVVEMKLLRRAAILAATLIALPNEEACVTRDLPPSVGLGHGGVIANREGLRCTVQAHRFGFPMYAACHSFTPARVDKSSMARLKLRSMMVFCGWPFFSS
jgi:hypothetical protein